MHSYLSINKFYIIFLQSENNSLITPFSLKM